MCSKCVVTRLKVCSKLKLNKALMYDINMRRT
nr:MAG TPA: hypothetical protein [Bacteriophage sp.]DAY13632.1 MAG TPA: hypothetical protein [Bacteriophage sp.]